MRGKRFIYTLRMFTIIEPGKRTEYMKRKRIYASMGDNCCIEDRVIPLYAKCIRLGNNVRLASHVCFITHDVSDQALNNMGLKTDMGGRFKERIGCIEIGDNVFIGAHCNILYDVKIGNNVIVGAGSVVVRDIPDNSVAVGVPAKVIGTFDEFVKKRRNERAYPDEFAAHKQEIPDALADWLWEQFRKKRSKRS